MQTATSRRATRQALLLAAGLMAVILTVVSLLSPAPAGLYDPNNRTEGGALRHDATYQGQERALFNGQPVNPEGLDNLVGRNWLDFPPATDLAQFMGASQPVEPLVTDLARLEPRIQGRTTAERALSDIRYRLRAGLPVNILPGSYYALPPSGAVGAAAGSVDLSLPGRIIYANPMLYIERNGEQVVTALVTTGYMNDLNALDRQLSGIAPLQPAFVNNLGLSLYEPMGDTRFIDDQATHRTWTARSFSGDCRWGELRANCLYRTADEQLFGLGGVIAVLDTGHLQYDVPETYGLAEASRRSQRRAIADTYAAIGGQVTADGKDRGYQPLAPHIGQGYLETEYDAVPAGDVLAKLMTAGELAVMGGNQLAGLPAYGVATAASS